MNHEPDTSDLTWRDAWDLDDAMAVLAQLATRAERSGDYSTATTLSNCIWWMEEAQERIDDLEEALDKAWDHIKSAQQAIST